MHVTRFQQAPAYTAPGHFDMRCLRLQGKEAGPSVQMWMGMSIIEPGGRTELDPSAIEKLYFVARGELTVVGAVDGQVQRSSLGTFDSCRFAPGEARQLINDSDQQALVVLVMACAPPQVEPGA
jgi:hypothetical protein